jgi:hypothetical protein
MIASGAEIGGVVGLFITGLFASPLWKLLRTHPVKATGAADCGCGCG